MSIFKKKKTCNVQGSDPNSCIKTVALVGSPNVGKSVLFNALTGSYVTVSNYPGTSVDVTRGRAQINRETYEIIDTPGMYSLMPITEEERVARTILLRESPNVVIHVVDARLLERMLPMTIQLIEANLPLILVLNIIDETERLGIKIDTALLRKRLGIPVIEAASVKKRGIEEIKAAIEYVSNNSTFYNSDIGQPISSIASRLKGSYNLLPKITIAKLLVQGDKKIHELVKNREGAGYNQIIEAINDEIHQGRSPSPMYLHNSSISLNYSAGIEKDIQSIAAMLRGDYRLSKKTIATLLMQGDKEITELVMHQEAERYDQISRLVKDKIYERRGSFNLSLSIERKNMVSEIMRDVFKVPDDRKQTFSDRLSRWCVNPLTGIPLLLIVLYFGLYQFVGVFGAGTVVDFVEEGFFEELFNPWITELVTGLISWELFQELIIGEYGVATLGLRYAVGIILPIVGTFFLFFAILEDSGYLPRLALMVDLIFKRLGLSGRAVIPIVLGLGCDTMATMVTRTLETSRERIIATVLLALAIPCSAQMGVILGLLSQTQWGLIVWGGTIALLFVMVGTVSAKILPGNKPIFYMELPPMRIPQLSNVLTKTYSKMKWYFFEILPLFLLISVILWFGKITNLLDRLVEWVSPLMSLIGLPREAAVAFIFGFFRRDYGAAGLFDLQTNGLLDPKQLVVAAVTLTLFIPCVAQFLVMRKERGLKTAMLIVLFVSTIALMSGFLLNKILTLVDIV